MSTLSSAILPLFPSSHFPSPPTASCKPPSRTESHTFCRLDAFHLYSRESPPTSFCPETNSSRQLSIASAPLLFHQYRGQPPSYISARACREELERGEAVDFHCLYFIGCWIHLGNDNVLMVPVGLSQLVPDRSQLLTVTTPGGIC